MKRYTKDRPSPFVERNLADNGWITTTPTDKGTCAVPSDAYGNPIETETK